jgi:hypothetical protein
MHQLPKISTLAKIKTQHLYQPAPEIYFRNYTSNKVLDISIGIWKVKAIVIFQIVIQIWDDSLVKNVRARNPWIMPIYYFFNGWNDGFREHAPRKGFHIDVMVMYFYQ